MLTVVAVKGEEDAVTNTTSTSLFSVSDEKSEFNKSEGGTEEDEAVDKMPLFSSEIESQGENEKATVEATNTFDYLFPGSTYSLYDRNGFNSLLVLGCGTSDQKPSKAGKAPPIDLVFDLVINVPESEWEEGFQTIFGTISTTFKDGIDALGSFDTISFLEGESEESVCAVSSYLSSFHFARNNYQNTKYLIDGLYDNLPLYNQSYRNPAVTIDVSGSQVIEQIVNLYWPNGTTRNIVTVTITKDRNDMRVNANRQVIEGFSVTALTVTE